VQSSRNSEWLVFSALIRNQNECMKQPTKLHLMQDAIQCANPKFEIKIHNSSAL